jgi:hypothetical protein
MAVGNALNLNPTNHAVQVGNASGGLTSLAVGATGQVLQGNTGADPSWGAAGAGTVTSVSGTANQVSVATGTTTPVISLVGPYTPATYTAHGVLVGEGTSSIVATATGSAGQALLSGGASADPAWSTPTYPSASGTSRKILVSDGTNNVYSTETWATPSTSGNVLTSNGTNWLSTAQTSKGFTLQMQTSGTGANPADSTTYFLAYASATTLDTTSGFATQRLFIPVACTMSAIYGLVRVGGTLGTSENSTLTIRINNTTDVTVTSTLKMNAADNTFNNTSLATSMSAGDYIEFKLTTPAWATNPTTVGTSMTVFFTIAN